MSFRSLKEDKEQSREDIGLHRLLCRQRSSSTPNLCNVSAGEVNAKDSRGRTVLFYAAKYGQTEIVRQLLEAGCDPNIADHNKNTPLHEATDGSHMDVIRLLVKNGCDLNVKNLLGQTPLMRAMLFDDIEIVKFLHKSGANVDETDCTGKSALLIGLRDGREKSCLYLIKHGCDVNIVDKLGQSALYLSIQAKEKCSPVVCKKLLTAGYQVDKDSKWLSKTVLQEINSYGKNIVDRIKIKFGQKKSRTLQFVQEDADDTDIPHFKLLDICG